MELQVRENGKVRILDLDGNLTIGREDLVLREKFRSFLHDGHTLFLLNLEKVSYIDSSGVASLVEAFQTAKKAGSAFGLVSVNPAAMRVLELARLDKVFTIHATLAEGLGGGS